MNFTKQVKRVWAGNVESKERKKKKKKLQSSNPTFPKGKHAQKTQTTTTYWPLEVASWDVTLRFLPV